MTTLNESLALLEELDGFIAAALGDAESGMALGSAGGGSGFNTDVAIAANTEVVKAKLRAMVALRLDDAIEDILITLGSQYHLIRPMRQRPQIFLYLALERSRANLALARLKLADVENRLVL